MRRHPIGIRTVNDHHREQFARFGVEVIEMARWEPDLRLAYRDDIVAAKLLKEMAGMMIKNRKVS